MSDLLEKLSAILGPRARKQALPVFGLVLVMALVEMLGVASIMPFIALLSNPSVLETNEYLARAFRALHFESHNDFLVFLGSCTLALLIGSVVLRALTLWFQLRFINMQTHLVSSRLFAFYLRQPYEWFLLNRSADIGANILAEVTNVFQGAVYPCMLLFANVVVALLLMSLLIAADPMLAMSATLVIGGIYWGVFVLGRKYLERIGEIRVRSNRGRHQALQEAFFGIKDIKVTGTEISFLDRFRAPSERMARASVAAALVSELPSFVMQAVVFGGMLAVMIYLMTAYGSLQGALPLMSLYALAGYRLLPTLQSAYRNVTSIRFTVPAVDNLYGEVMEFHGMFGATEPEDSDFRRPEALGLRDKLEVNDLSFRYAGAERPALHGLTLTIPARSTVAFVGATGSGKTTAVDTILGLLAPSSGELVVDGKRIDDRMLRAWQRSIGYVPQSIFLSDDTITRNIALGVRPEAIDANAVERAARLADLHEFVVSELPAGYETVIGERGVRLSGGQRQRIGIARALYHDPDLLIFDEATSALDNVTEHAVMEAIYGLARKKTVVMIAHRLSTIRGCDAIFVFERGEVVAKGTYEELLAGSASFRAMALGGSGVGGGADEVEPVLNEPDATDRVG